MSLSERLRTKLATVEPLDDVTDVAPVELFPDTFAARLYEMLAPLARADPDNAFSLLIYINAVGVMFQLVEDLVRDTPDGPGWSILLDLDRCPDEALPWLGQFAGVRIPAGFTADQARARIASTDGFKRGTRNALIGAARATLTGNQHVYFRERSGDPAVSPDYAYYLDVSTYTSETPNPAATEAALLAQKPGGIVLTFTVNDGQSWRQVSDTGLTWQQVKDGYATWDDVRKAMPS
jgi:hypothetical protein